MFTKTNEVDRAEEVYDIKVSITINGKEVSRNLQYERVDTTPEMIADRVSEHAYSIVETLTDKF